MVTCIYLIILRESSNKVFTVILPVFNRKHCLNMDKNMNNTSFVCKIRKVSGSAGWNRLKINEGKTNTKVEKCMKFGIFNQELKPNLKCLLQMSAISTMF
ncbi:hypothetical protein GOODEAATRI_006893 [Goodea atripinnis]|uniref:Uncharacterized protein n=1 Tax=Goodea atripinnis TaxID=208336 RepID=A0ABV0MZB3_9TELE